MIGDIRLGPISPTGPTSDAGLIDAKPRSDAATLEDGSLSADAAAVLDGAVDAEASPDGAVDAEAAPSGRVPPITDGSALGVYVRTQGIHVHGPSIAITVCDVSARECFYESPVVEMKLPSRPDTYSLAALDAVVCTGSNSAQSACTPLQGTLVVRDVHASCLPANFVSIYVQYDECGVSMRTSRWTSRCNRNHRVLHVRPDKRR